MIFGDNVSYHTSKVTREQMEVNGTYFIGNIVAVPELSPVESFFARMKDNYRQMKLDRIVSGQAVDTGALLAAAAEAVTFQTIRNICARGLK